MKISGKQKCDEYILIAPGSDYGRAMWSDIGELENGSVLEKAIASENRLVNLLHHIHFSFALNSRMQLPFQNVWENAYALSKIHLQPSKKYCIIYTDVSAGRTDVKFLKKLHERKNVTLVLALVNTMDRKRKIMEARLPYFHQIYSFDKRDAQQYGFMYHPTFYSRADRKDMKIKQDAFFVGVARDRLDILHKLYEKMRDCGIEAQFYISKVKRPDRKYPDIHYNRWLSYADVLTQVMESNCIVEVMGGSQKGVTMRTMEAICYNKRLLTNNQAVRDLPFYDERFISIFSDVDDIDWSFVRERSPVEYVYRDEFSPIRLIDQINETAREEQ